MLLQEIYTRATIAASQGGLCHVSARQADTYEAMLSAYLHARAQCSPGKTLVIRISETFMARAPLLLLRKIFADARENPNTTRVRILALNPYCEAARQRCSTVVGNPTSHDKIEPLIRISCGLGHILEALNAAENRTSRDKTGEKILRPGDEKWKQGDEGGEPKAPRELKKKIYDQLKEISKHNLVLDGTVRIRFYENDFFPCTYMFGDILSTPFSLVMGGVPEEFNDDDDEEGQEVDANSKSNPGGARGELNGNQLECPFIFWTNSANNPFQPIGLGYNQLVKKAKTSFAHRYKIAPKKLDEMITYAGRKSNWKKWVGGTVGGGAVLSVPFLTQTLAGKGIGDIWDIFWNWALEK